MRVAEHRADAVPVHPSAGGAALARLGYRRCSRRAGGALTGRALGHAGVTLAGAAVGGIPGGGVWVDGPIIAGTCRRGVGLSTARRGTDRREMTGTGAGGARVRIEGFSSTIHTVPKQAHVRGHTPRSSCPGALGTALARGSHMQFGGAGQDGTSFPLADEAALDTGALPTRVRGVGGRLAVRETVSVEVASRTGGTTLSGTRGYGGQTPCVALDLVLGKDAAEAGKRGAGVDRVHHGLPTLHYRAVHVAASTLLTALARRLGLDSVAALGGWTLASSVLALHDAVKAPAGVAGRDAPYLNLLALPLPAPYVAAVGEALAAEAGHQATED